MTNVKRRSALTLGGLVAGLLMLTGCSVGAYPVDYFQEMHYSQSVRRQEPPVMTAPDTAVGYGGLGSPEADLSAGPAYSYMSREALAAITTNPLPNNQTVMELGAALFTSQACAVCHGPNGDGQGPGALLIGGQFEAQGMPRPADLTSDAIRNLTDGEIFAALTYGFGEVPAPSDAADPAAYTEITAMPAFGKLLTDDERWALVRHIRMLQE